MNFLFRRRLNGVKGAIFRTSSLNAGESFWLDVLRGSALIVIILAHAQQVFISPYWFSDQPIPDLRIGGMVFRKAPTIALMSFFSMSGFLIFHSVARSMQKYGYFRPEVYFLARFNRIFPPLLLSLFFLVGVYMILGWLGYAGRETFTTGSEVYLVRDSVFIDWKNIFGSLLLINTLLPGWDSPNLNGPMWSVSHEFWFYMFGMVLIWFFTKSRIIAIAFLFLVSFFAFFEVEFWFYGMVVWLVAFGMGYLEYAVGRRLSTVVGLAGGSVVFVIWLWMISHYNESWYFFRMEYAFGVLLSFYFPFLLRLARRDSRDRKGWFVTAIAKCAQFSYSMYLLHFPWFIFVFVLTNKMITSWSQRVLMVIFALVVIFSVSIFFARMTESKKARRILVEWLF